MHSNVTETIKLLNIKLIGHYRYYGITDNIESLRQYYEVVAYMLFKTLNRRTQRNKYSYKEYYEKIEKKIVRPRIYQDIIKNGICNVKKVVYEELRALIAHAQFCEGVKWRRLALLDVRQVKIYQFTKVNCKRSIKTRLVPPSKE